MENQPLFWFCLTILCLCIQSTFSMLEMASVSFNKVRLQYYVSKGKYQAIWLNYLLQKPSRLFGTTLLMVNAALQIGSECSRELYQSLGLVPDFAILTQVVLVLIFAELSPMFAARRYAENVVMLGIPVLYGVSRIVAPAVDLLEFFMRWITTLFGGKKAENPVFLTREEIQHVLEETKGDHQDKDKKKFNKVVNNIFMIHGKVARDIMHPLTRKTVIMPSDLSVGEIREKFHKYPPRYILISSLQERYITGVVFIRDLIGIHDKESIRRVTKPLTFISEMTPLITILQHLRKGDSSNLVIVLDKQGNPSGYIELSDLLDEIFDYPHMHVTAK